MVNIFTTGENHDVSDLADYLEEQDDLFRAITIRQDYPGSAHAPTECIYYRGPHQFDKDTYFETLSSLDYEVPKELQRLVQEIVMPFCLSNSITELGRILIVKLLPNGKLTEHVDEGYYADYFTRFHIPITTTPESFLVVNGEKKHVEVGECAWFNHKLPHYAVNGNEEESRIHLIIDAVSNKWLHPNDMEE